jgi:soluble lytic murein transglycosylase-like protein
MIETLIATAAQAVGVPAALLLAICTHESAGLNNIVIPHDGGSPSIGYCMLKKSTAEMMGYSGPGTGKLKLDEDLTRRYKTVILKPVGQPRGLMVPEVNVHFAALYLKFQLDRYGDDWCKAAAAYNAGQYNPSMRALGKPRNLKYVKKIAALLPDEERHMISCGRLEAKR